MKKLATPFLVVGALASAFVVGRCTAPNRSAQHEPDAHALGLANEGAASEDSEFICPMHPQVRQPEFGTCPICFMDLVPVSSGGEDSVIDIAQFSEASTALLNIETTHVKREHQRRLVRTFGEVVSASSSDARVSSWTNGRVERLYVTDIGATVRQGDRIARVWAPELASLVQTLRDAASLPDPVGRSVASGARQQLQNAGLSDREIQELVQSNEPSPRITLRAKSSGTVIERHIREGDYVREGDPILTLNNTSKLWAELQVLESDVAGIHPGQSVTLSSRDGRTIPSAKVSFVPPAIDPATRSLRVRIEWESEDSLPVLVGQRVYAEIEIESDRAVLSVPQDAVLWTGERSIVFIVDRSASSPIYQPTEVILGERWGDRVEVIEGIYPGEEVVSQGAFRIDASIYLRSGGGMLRTGSGEKEANHEH